MDPRPTKTDPPGSEEAKGHRKFHWRFPRKLKQALIAVLAIMATVLGVATWTWDSVWSRDNLQESEAAILRYRQDFGRWPASEKDLPKTTRTSGDEQIVYAMPEMLGFIGFKLVSIRKSEATYHVWSAEYLTGIPYCQKLIVDVPH